MLNKIKALSTASKYTDWYCSIVMAAQLRSDKVEGENHHIVPRSVWKEGAKFKDNIVRLTYREHYICHKLLVKMLIEKAHVQKMSFALWRLAHKRAADGLYNSRDYAHARKLYSNAMKQLWTSTKFRSNMLNSRKWFYESEEQKAANRARGKERMQNKEYREKIFSAANAANKLVRDADPKKWVKQSMGTDAAKQKAKEVQRSAEHREYCRQRELNKTAEERSKLGKSGQIALMEKCGGEEEYRKYLSNRIKGRKRYINVVDGSCKMLREPIEGYVLAKDLRK